MRRSLLGAAVATSALLAITAAMSGATRSRQAAENPAATLDDATIVAIFDAANTADIETGELAAERGQSKEVRDFGAMLARDHKFVRQQGRDLAAKLRVTPTPPADSAAGKAHATAMTDLRSKRGAEFDRAFLRHEIAFHKSVVDAINTTLLPAIANAELKALVVKVGPAFEAHMIGAQTLEKRIAGSGEPSQRPHGRR